MPISLPGLARFGCDVSATVGGFPRTKADPGARQRAVNSRAPARPCFRASVQLIGRLFLSGQFYQSVGPLSPNGAVLQAIADRDIGGATRGKPRPQQDNAPQDGQYPVFECDSLWRFGNTAREGDRATNYFFGVFGRWGCRRRTPGPPPFSSMNSTPAASSVRRTAKSLAMVIDVSPAASSARLIVASPNADSRASSAALHRRRARAARIWALFKGFHFMLTTTVSYDTNRIL
jgi:hypothetical protein